jgi:hypothetical protein
MKVLFAGLNLGCAIAIFSTDLFYSSQGPQRLCSERVFLGRCGTLQLQAILQYGSVSLNIS